MVWHITYISIAKEKAGIIIPAFSASKSGLDYSPVGLKWNTAKANCPADAAVPVGEFRADTR